MIVLRMSHYTYEGTHAQDECADWYSEAYPPHYLWAVDAEEYAYVAPLPGEPGGGVLDHEYTYSSREIENR
jgi:hypothetical protein